MYVQEIFQAIKIMKKVPIIWEFAPIYNLFPNNISYITQGHKLEQISYTDEQ
jgi:hypothetical protein